MARSQPDRTDDIHSNGVPAQLVERRERLEEQLASIEAEARTMSGGIGFGKRIGEGTNIAVERLVEVATHDRLLGELETVRRAEEKYAAGEGGVCDVCGSAIPPARLEAIPWAIKCVGCASH